MNQEVAGWIEEALSEPVVYDGYRGVAVIYTPHFRIIRKAPPTAERYVIKCNEQAKSLVQLKGTYHAHV
jgi:hypothetical protein